jgi:uncharacterized metal-binding protein
MPETQSQELNLEDLKQGELVWLDYYKKLGIFEEYNEYLGYMFRNTNGIGFCIVNNSKVYAPSSLMKELF